MVDLEGLADEDFCYLTTTGRVTGLPHIIEIWFGIRGTTLYMLAGGRNRADWVRNIRQTPAVTVRIRNAEFAGRGRMVADAGEDTVAREMLVGKYQPGYDGDLTEWGRTALPVAIDLNVMQ